jgi:hypothetical protein
MSNPRLKDLRGPARRNFIRWVGAAGAAVALERSKLLNFLLDEGGEAIAQPAACATTNRSVHLVGGNGSFAWFQLLWPHVDVAKANDPSFAWHAMGEGFEHLGGDKPFYYGPEAPWQQGGIPSRPVTAYMAGANETHTQTPTTAAMVTSGTSMTATVASIQRATASLLPVIGVVPANLGVAPGAPSIATVPNAQGMVELFNSAASQAALADPENRELYETYYKAIIGLRAGSGRATWAKQLDITKTAVNLVGRNLAGELTPLQEDLDAYKITEMLASTISQAAKDRLVNLGRALITTKKAMTQGLTNSVIIGLSPGATSETSFTDPHPMFNDMVNLRLTAYHLGQMLDAFYLDLANAPDPACVESNLSETVIFTVHGDTPHTPLQRDAWPDATPGNSNWLYVMGNGYLKNGWFGGVRADGTVDGFNPTTGENMPGQPAANTSNAAGAAVAYAVAKGNLTKVKEYYTGPEITALIDPP